MGVWNSSPHPISDVRDWQQAGRLELRPDFQRREVWSQAARIMLIDTILREIPMPKMFVWNELVKASTHRKVIDGQQRVLAILDYLDDKFALEEPYEGPFKGKKFSDLPQGVRDRFFHYQIDFNEAVGFSDEEVREVYSRVNKYSLPLNRQELRQADYPGAFLNLSGELALDEYFDQSGIITPTNRRRMGDVEFASELLSGMLEGPQDKKRDLDYFYARYAKWAPEEVDQARKSFTAVLADLKIIFDEVAFPIKPTRFRQKADFYSLFLAVHGLLKIGFTIKNKNPSQLRRDLTILDQHIAPESDVPILSEYAVKCVSQANSHASRSWRRNFLTDVLAGTYRQQKPSGATLRTFTSILENLHEPEQSPLFDECVICGEDLRGKRVTRVLDWPARTKYFQLSNAGWRGDPCDGPVQARD